ncbi:MAG TPA: sigma-70 family RNA polymerase sigma factor [Solirubrobacteraceae bacterium]|nr:sigma-70 family RNA polymerase sigma factor [Solirubrobacteraceae bacterium]
MSPREHIGRHPDEDRRRRLLRRYARHRDPGDLERLVVSYRSLARGLARRYATASPSAEDLEQVAYEGLIKAIQRFEPGRGTAFTSFAVPTILGELRRYLRDTVWPAHVPRPLQERVRQVRLAAAAFTARQGRSPTAREIADALHCDVEAVVDALEVTSSLSVASLDARAPEPENGRLAPAELVGSDDPGYDRVECLATIEQALPALTSGQKRALRLHFAEDLTSREMARRLGVSRSQAARELDSAVTVLRQLQAA